MLPKKRFKVVNDGFTCANCSRAVPPTSGTSPRNHCPFCLWCMHVDIDPGDRANPCRGQMRPIGVYTHTRKAYVILHQCQRCGARVRAKAALGDGSASDDFDLLIELAGRPIEEEKPLPPHMLRLKGSNRRRTK